MKKTILFSLLSLLLFTACQNDDKPNMPLTEVGEWKLEQLTPVRSSEVIPASELDFTETYHFSENGTFTKFSTRTEMELSGIYEEIFIEANENSNENRARMFQLTFDMDQYEAILEHEEGWNRSYIDLYVYGVNNMEFLILREDHTMYNRGHRSHGDFMVYTRK